MTLKNLLIAITAFISLAATIPPDCGDGTVYANKKQTENDKRFDNYPKIKGAPKYASGEKSLTNYIESKLELSNDAKQMIFNLNYQFTVTCDGQITDIKVLGDQRAESLTNIVEVLASTAGEWAPALAHGKPIDCIYFNTFFVNGSLY